MFLHLCEVPWDGPLRKYGLLDTTQDFGQNPEMYLKVKKLVTLEQFGLLNEDCLDMEMSLKVLKQTVYRLFVAVLHSG